MLNSKALVLMIFFFCALIALLIVAVSWQLSARRKAQVAVTGGTEFRQLADEYRRLSELAVTAQEHTDLRLEEVTTKLGQLRAQLDSVQNILKEVE